MSNNSSRYGGAICSKGSTTYISECIIKNNEAYDGGGVMLNSTRVKQSNGRYSTKYGNVEMTDCIIEDNNNLNSEGQGSGIRISGNTFTATNVKVINNGTDDKYQYSASGMYINCPSNKVTLNNCEISGNVSNIEDYAGGMKIEESNIIMNNTVVKNNTGEKIGGIYLYDTAIRMEGGAVYNNTAKNVTKDYDTGAAEYAHDFSITVDTWEDEESLAVDIPKAANMKDNDIQFDDYFWSHTALDTNCSYEETYGVITAKYDSICHIYNALNVSRMTAEVWKENEVSASYKCLTIDEAVDIANDGDTIKIIAPNISETVSIDGKQLIIDLNESCWRSGSITIGENANISIKGNGAISNIICNGESLELNSDAAIDKITLKTGCFVKAGENFDIPNEITFEITEEDNARLDIEDIRIIKGNGKLSEDILSKIKFINTDYLAVPKLDDFGDVVVHKLKGVFVDGINGDDSNDGLSEEKPVKTFKRAKEIFEGLSEERKSITDIYVMGTVSGSGEWSLEEGRLLRYPGFKDYLVEVDGELTLKNITIDGQNDKTEANEALIKVGAGDKLYIKDGTKITNNAHTKLMNIVESGGAIELWGQNTKMVLDGGIIKNNASIGIDNRKNAGAGIAVMDGASLTMNDGEISDNKCSYSDGVGGGVMVGVVEDFTGAQGSTFFMNGGKILRNIAMENGGGIFIQCSSLAQITKGDISYNKTVAAFNFTQGAYGGGGIYVNGRHNNNPYGKLYLSNAYLSENIADSNEGNAIAGCGTSTTIIHPESTTIYNNNSSKEDGSQIYVDSTRKTGYGNIANVSISQYAMGEGIYNWSDESGKVSGDKLTNLESEEILKISNNDAENLDKEGNLASVRIIGNQSKTRGGGIGSNGFVQIGEEINVEVNVNKIWKDANNVGGTRPEKVTINLYANGNLIATKTISEADGWTYTFEGLKKYGEDGNLNVYTITEDKVDGYKTEIDGFDITNTYEKIGDLEDSEPSDDQEDHKKPSGLQEKPQEDKITISVKTGDNISLSIKGLIIALFVQVVIVITKRINEI